MVVRLNSFGGGFFLKIPSKNIAFALDLSCIHSLEPSLEELEKPRRKKFSETAVHIFCQVSSNLFENTTFFNTFLRVKFGFFGVLNTALPFQHRNKIGFLCVT